MNRSNLVGCVLFGLLLLLPLMTSCDHSNCNNTVTSDPSAEWIYLGLGDFTLSDIAVDPADENVIYVARTRISSPDENTPRLFRTRDGGEHWDTLKTDLNGWILSLDIAGDGSGVVYAAGDFPEGPLLSSSDSGNSWEAEDILGVSLNAGDFGSLIRSNPYQPGVQFLGTSDGDTLGGLYRRDALNSSWTPMLLEQGETMAVSDLTFSGPDGDWLGAAPWVDSLICFSYDGGDTWHSLANPDTLWRVFSVLVDPTDQNRIYTACNFLGLMGTSDGGTTWLNHLELPFENLAQRLRILKGEPVSVMVQWESPYLESVRLFARKEGEWVEIGDGLPFIREYELHVSTNGIVLFYGFGIYMLLDP